MTRSLWFDRIIGSWVTFHRARCRMLNVYIWNTDRSRHGKIRVMEMVYIEKEADREVEGNVKLCTFSRILLKALDILTPVLPRIYH